MIDQTNRAGKKTCIKRIVSAVAELFCCRPLRPDDQCCFVGLYIGVKRRHRIYDHDTIDRHFVGNNMAQCVEKRREDLSCYLNNIRSIGL